MNWSSDEWEMDQNERRARRYQALYLLEGAKGAVRRGHATPDAKEDLTKPRQIERHIGTSRR